MDVKFDAVAAERLIKNMDEYYNALRGEVAALNNTLRLTDQWNDPQATVFRSYIEELYRKMQEELRKQYEYKQIFEKRVQELRR